MTAKQRYDYLRSYRDDFLGKAVEASQLTLPYLVKQDDDNSNHKNLKTPWQSVGAKGVTTLASKLMIALLPPQSSFFQLQLDESKLAEQGMDPKMKSNLDVSFAKIERIIMDLIAQSDDRVVLHQALKHLVVSGNALIFMDKEKLKSFPLNRYVIERDGMGNVIEIVTKEQINKKLLPALAELEQPQPMNPDAMGGNGDECDIYTHVKREGKMMTWYQEVYGKIVPGTISKSPIDTNPWLPIRFNVVDNEDYGRGRVEEYIGDLKSLEALSQAMVEGSAAAAKVIFTVSPSSTTKPAALASAGNGAIIQGRPDDIGVVQVGKTADFATALQMMNTLERRLAEAFLIMQVRDSERTTAEEVRMTQMELDQQLGGLYSLLTVDFLNPYLNRKLSEAGKRGEIPKLPKDLVKPAIVAGVNAIGRGQDRDALTMFLTTIAQTVGPEQMMTYINPDEVIKRLAASQGIDVLGLVKSKEELQQEQMSQAQQQQEMELTKQTAAMQRNQMDQQNAQQQAPPQGQPPG